MGGVETSGAVYEDILDEMRLSEQNVGGHQYHLFVIEFHPGDSCNLAGLVLQPTGSRIGQFRRIGLMYLSLTEGESTVPIMEQEPWLQYEQKHGKDLYTITII